MTFPKARLAVAACLLIGWILYLGVLVYLTRGGVVLSKPQFLIAQLYIVVDLTDGTRSGPAPNINVEKVLWSADSADEQLAGKVLPLSDISACTKENGYKGPGKYLVPLMSSSPGSYLIAPVPRVDPYGRQALTHGSVEAVGVFSHRVRRRLPLVEAREQRKEWEKAGYDVSLTEEEIRIYPWNPETEAQLASLIAAKK